MIDFQQAVAALFELINCAVLIGLIAFLFKKYLLGSIRAQMSAQVEFIGSLRESFHMLTRNYQLLDREIEHERQVQYELKEKVMRWRAQVEQLHEQVQHERDERKNMAASQAKDQIKQVKRHMIYQEVLPRALDDARAELEKKFSDPQAQKEYLAHAVTVLCSKRHE